MVVIRAQGMRDLRRVGVAALVMATGTSVLGASGACSLAFPANQSQCTTSSDCNARGGAFLGSVCLDSVCLPRDASVQDDALFDATSRDADATSRDADATSRDADARLDARRLDAADSGGDWSCLGHVTYPEASPGRVLLTAPFVDILTDEPIVGMRVEPCLRLDPHCMEPLADAAFTNDSGAVTFSVMAGFAGYLLALWDAGVPNLVYITPPVFDSGTLPPTLEPTQATIAAVASALGAPDGGPLLVDPTRGLIFIGVLDCAMRPAAGVRFSISPTSSSAELGYLISDTPSLSATMTDSSGFAAFVNVPPGTVFITATLVATGQVTGTVTGFIEAGSITTFNLPTTPTP